MASFPSAAVCVAFSMLVLAECFLQRSSSALGSGATLSVSLQRRIIKAAAGDAHAALSGANGVHKMAYYGNVAVGSPAQDFQVVFDTGSGNLIIPGVDCGSRACTTHRQWDPKVSKTHEKVNCDGSEVFAGMMPDQITITFGTGEITGDCYSDKICVGTACSVGDFIASTEESSQPFASFGFDGVLGLARTSMAQGNAFSMMERLSTNGALRNPLFSVFLSDSAREVSEVTFGGIKEEHMASDMFWVDVTESSGYWEVLISDVTFDGKPQSLCENCKVAVDTGTSMLAGPSHVITQLRRKLNVKSDCSNYKTLPKLGFVVGGRVLDLSPTEYVNNRDGHYCEVTLMTLDVPPPKGPLFIFGIPFLQKYYTVYDHATAQVGFAVAKHVGEEPEALMMVGNATAQDPRSSSFLSRK